MEVQGSAIIPVVWDGGSRENNWLCNNVVILVELKWKTEFLSSTLKIKCYILPWSDHLIWDRDRMEGCLLKKLPELVDDAKDIHYSSICQVLVFFPKILNLNRIIGSPKFKGTCWDHWVQLLAPYRPTQVSGHMSECIVHTLLEVWQLGAVTAPLRSLFQGLSTLLCGPFSW